MRVIPVPLMLAADAQGDRLVHRVSREIR